MRFSSPGLGLKLNLALLLFFVLLGSITAAFILVGFKNTRNDATHRSQEALENLGALLLQVTAYVQGDFGSVEMEWAAEIGHRGSVFMEEFKEQGGKTQFDPSTLVQTEDDIWYDPNPDRITDVVVPNHVQLEGGVLDDLEYSASLDLLLPALFEGFPGELSPDAYHPIAIVFIGVNGVGRYYPPRDVHASTPAEIDISDFFDRFGPETNPDRLTYWTEPYEDLAGQGLVMTAQTPVYEGDEFRGIFEVDLSIDRLMDEVEGITPTRSGFAFYVDKNGEILKTGAYELLAQELAAGNGELAAVVEQTRDGGVGVRRVELGGREFFVSSASIAAGGGVAVVAPLSELTEDAAAITAGIDDQADRTMLVVLVSMTGLFFVALVGATYLNRRVLLRPIEALAAGTRAVAHGDFETRIEVRGDDELAALGHSFNRMTEDIQREVHNRQAAEQELAALFAAMEDVVMVFDGEGRCLRIAPTNPELLYAPPESVVGHTLHEILPAEQADYFLEAIKEALTDGAARTLEYPLRIRDRDYWFAATISPMSGGSVVYVARDITARVNARQELERQVAERTRQLTALLEVSRNVASTLELAPLLNLIIEQIESVAEYSRSSIYLLEGETLRLLASRTSDPDVATAPGSHQFYTPALGACWRRLTSGESVVIDDLQVENEQTTELRAALGPALDRASIGVHAIMIVPLMLNDRVLGMVSLNHREIGFYSEQHARLVAAIAVQAAAAIENARLYEQAQGLAAVEERQRLARELHDSVSQALYGIALGARTARTLLDQDPKRAVEPVDYVLQLAEAGLAEMRALIFELRPESLATEGLVAALEKQAAATRARYGLDVAAELGEEPDLSLHEKEVFYRIAQEALHNVVKHAHASRVELTLQANNGSVSLDVRDNGAGFDATQGFPGHMGLVSMRERAESISGEFRVESAPGAGASVRLALRR